METVESAPSEEPSSARRRETETAFAATFFLIAALAFTYPQPIALASVPVHPDPFLSIWRLEWTAHALTGGERRLFQANIFHPAARPLAFSDATLLEGVLATPLLWAGVPGVVVYNLLIIASFVVGGLGMFLLSRTLTGSASAGIVAGSIFAFAPFRLEHYMHLELLWSGWMPLTLYALSRTLTTGRFRFGVLTGAGVAIQAYFAVHYAIFLAVVLPVVSIACWVLRCARPTRRALGALAAGAAVAALVVAPYAAEYVAAANEVGKRSSAEVASYAATPLAYLSCPPVNWSCGWTYARWGANEKQLFPGLTALSLMFVALAARSLPRERWCFAVALALAVDLSFGLDGYSYPLLFRGPFAGVLRVPARAGMLVLALVAILAGYGAARLTTTSVRAASARRVTALILALLAIEYAHQPIALQRLPTGPDEFERWLRLQPPDVVLHLPVPPHNQLPGADHEFEFASTFDWHPIVNGYSGFYPPHYSNLLAVMRSFPDAASMAALRERNVRWIVIHEDEYLGRRNMLLGRVQGDTGRRVWGDHMEVPYTGVPLDSMIDQLQRSRTVTFIGRFASVAGAVRVYEVTGSSATAEPARRF
jgi:hypothetical protein